MKLHGETQESLSLQSDEDEGMKMYNCPRWEKSTVHPLRTCNRFVWRRAKQRKKIWERTPQHFLIVHFEHGILIFFFFFEYCWVVQQCYRNISSLSVYCWANHLRTAALRVSCCRPLPPALAFVLHTWKGTLFMNIYRCWIYKDQYSHKCCTTCQDTIKRRQFYMKYQLNLGDFKASLKHG